jgi:hypothetical protein
LAVDQRVLDLMHATADLVDGVGTGQRAEAIWHQLEILALFDRCRSLHRAVLALLSQGFVHEAVILDRPLFTDSLALGEFAAVDDERRGSLVVGWALGSLQHLKAYFLDRQSRGHESEAELRAITERETQVEQYARDHGFGTRRWQPDDDAKRLARDQGRDEEYSALLVAQMFVHGTTTVTSDRYLQTEGVFVVGGDAPTPKRWMRDTGLWASHSMLLGARAVSGLFGWAEPVELGNLLKSVREEAIPNAGALTQPG